MLADCFFVSDELRENRRDLRKSQRELDRERSRLQREKRQIEQDIRKASRDGQQGAVRTMAKRLIQVRKQEERLLGSKAQLSSMDTNMVVSSDKALLLGAFEVVLLTLCDEIQSAHANYTVGKTMGNAAEIMKKQNNTMQHQITAKNAQDFARVSEQSKMTEEMMDDALGDIVSEWESILSS